MTPRFWMRLRSRIQASDDTGATLVIVMFIVTTIALVLGATLAQADTSVRATVALRDQAGSAYNGDGAAQVAINTLRNSTFANDVGKQCFSSGTSGTLTLPNFYPATRGAYGSASASAAVTCTAEAGTGAQGSPVQISGSNKPGQAILTLGNSVSEDGQGYGQASNTITIHGAVTSDSDVTVLSTPASLNVTGGVPIKAIGACSGTIAPACTKITTAVADPNYPAPADTPVVPVMPACNNKNKVAVFLPGLYRSADTFNNCNASWIYLSPGPANGSHTYYFDFTTGSHIWSPTNVTVVAGTLTAAQSDTPPAVPGACKNPISDPTPNEGLTLVFGGDSQLAYQKGSNVEFCASYSKTSIPTVLYGLKADVGSGANTVHAQSGCVVTIGSGGCDFISDGGNGTKPNFFYEGFVYAPQARINIAVNNSTQPFFNFGMIVRSLTLTTTGSATTQPLISLPDNSPGYGTASTFVNLTVYVCPGASTCDSSGHKELTTRVRVNDPTGTPVAGARQITVLSWSNQR
jgi:hypothetical protein